MTDQVASAVATRSVFISHASKNFKVADSIRDILEARGVSCWIAPRDIQPGKQYGTSIIDGISKSSVFLLLLTDESNLSPAVQNEVERAFGYQKTIIPVRISDVKPGKEIEFFVSNAQWVDAIYQPLKRRMDEVAAIVQAIEMSAKPPPVQPEKKTLLGTVEKFFEQAFRHKTISFIAGFTILASMIVMGIYLQSRSMGALDKASSSIQQSGTEISAAAVTIKDSGEKVAALGGKLDGLKKETSDDPKKELANMGLAWHEQAFFSSLGDPKIAGLFIQGGMKLSKELVVTSIATISMPPEALSRLVPGGGVDFYGACPGFPLLETWLPQIRTDTKKFEVFTSLCNANGEFTNELRNANAKISAAYEENAKSMERFEKKLASAKIALQDAQQAWKKQGEIESKLSSEYLLPLVSPDTPPHLKKKMNDDLEVERRKAAKLKEKVSQLENSLSTTGIAIERFEIESEANKLESSAKRLKILLDLLKK
jgi:hypothetical protein